MNWKLCNVVMLIAFTTVACGRGSATASIELSGLNYKDVGISEFSVDGNAGHSIFPDGGGGKFVCCVTIPKKWESGMKVNVRWVEDASVLGPWKERTVDVPAYTEKDIGTFAVHFYPDDTVKVLVTTKIIGHPEYPYPRPN